MCGLKNILIARTGYTGEDGFEIYLPSDVATSERVWNEVMSAGREYGILPCGLGARNTLRLEAKMALYEHEISDTINVWEAGLERYCKLDKGDFVGREALEQAAAAGWHAHSGRPGNGGTRHCTRRLSCCDESGNAVGMVTSGSPSPTLGKNIALAYVPPALSADRHNNSSGDSYAEMQGASCD